MLTISNKAVPSQFEVPQSNQNHEKWRTQPQSMYFLLTQKCNDFQCFECTNQSVEIVIKYNLDNKKIYEYPMNKMVNLLLLLNQREIDGRWHEYSITRTIYLLYVNINYVNQNKLNQVAKLNMMEAFICQITNNGFKVVSMAMPLISWKQIYVVYQVENLLCG